MKKLILILMLGIMFIIVISAQPHQQDTSYDLIISSNNATLCNMSYIQYPNNTKITYNQTLTRDGQTFSATIPEGNFSQNGETCMGITCFDGSQYEVGSICVEVNYFGKELSQSQSTLYIALLGILVFILFINFWGIGQLPKSNQKDEEGRILSITYLKHFRLVLWLFAYFLFVAIIFLSSNIAFAFLSEQLFATLLFNLFRILLGFSPLIIILLVISFFVKLYHDKEMQKLLNRGIFPGSNL